LEFISAYTWSHAISDVCTPLSYPTGCSANGYQGPPDPYNLRSGYANALWDIRHNFTTGFTYELPVGRGRMYGNNMGRALDEFVGGWQLGGIITIRTGIPLSLSYNGCQGQWAICEPNVVAGMNPNAAPAGGRSAAQWFNTAAVVAAAPGTGGDAGVFNISAPGNSTFDASLFKTFRITERFNAEFRLEAFNAFNKTQLGQPDTNLQDATFGKITTNQLGTERHGQVSLRVHFQPAAQASRRARAPAVRARDSIGSSSPDGSLNTARINDTATVLLSHQRKLFQHRFEFFCGGEVDNPPLHAFGEQGERRRRSLPLQQYERLPNQYPQLLELPG
jgi:hypothetical protein